MASAEVCPNAASRSGPSASLPDCRVFEMVSPVNNEGGNVYTPDSGRESLGDAVVGEGGATLFEAAPDGSAVTYDADPLSAGNGLLDAYLATRDPSGGWTVVNLEPPGYNGVHYQGFSEELSEGILSTCEEPLLAPEAPSGGYNILYSHINGDGGGSGYRALITVKPSQRLPCKNGAASFRAASSGFEELLYAGGTADLSHILFEANDALTANATPTGAEENNLYDLVGGELRLVNVLPGQDRGEPDATFGSPWQEQLDPPDFSHVISDDGSRIFWTDLKTGDLYVRENSAETVQVDALQGGSGSAGGGWFWTASSNGEKAFFTDCSRLTADSTAVSSGGCGAPNILGGPQGNDLYEYDLAKPVGERLTDLTVDHNAGDLLGADVQGVIGASENGEYVYFVAGGVLAPGAAHGECDRHTPESLCNVYVRHDGVTTFIATLAAEDDTIGGLGAGGGNFGDWQPNLGHRSAEVTPDGGSVVFMSDRSLTGYDNVVNGEAMDEVYVYDAETERLSCASCDPSGAPPSAFYYFGKEVKDTSFLPVSGNPAGEINTYMPQWISDAGDRVFFDSVEPLVPQDTNGLRDVYEWERDGAGSCQDSGGCIYLLSGGTSTDSSSFVDASANGNDVFLVSRAQLVPQDHDEEFNLYDVRVGGVQSLVSPACSGTGCQGVPSAPPLFATPPSATFNGVGNFEPLPPAPTAKPKAKPVTRTQKLTKALKACRTKPKKRRAACRAQARKSYGARSKAKKSSLKETKQHV